MDDFPVDIGTRAQGRALGSGFEAGPQGAHFLGIGMADVIEHFSEIGDHVWGRAAFRDDVVDARIHAGVLAHHVDHHVHRLDPVERAAPAFGRAGSMGGDAAETELGRTVGKAGPRGRAVLAVGVPVQRDIDILEQAGAGHVDLARAAFFGRRAVQPDAPGRAGLFQPAFDRDRRRQRASAEEVVPAGMARAQFGLLARGR